MSRCAGVKDEQPGNEWRRGMEEPDSMGEEEEKEEEEEKKKKKAVAFRDDLVVSENGRAVDQEREIERETQFTGSKYIGCRICKRDAGVDRKGP